MTWYGLLHYKAVTVVNGREFKVGTNKRVRIIIRAAQKNSNAARGKNAFRVAYVLGQRKAFYLSILTNLREWVNQREVDSSATDPSWCVAARGMGTYLEEEEEAG